MRYDERVTFRTLIKGTGYDPNTGKTTPDTYEEKIIPADVTDLGIKSSTQIFGEYLKGSKIVRIQRPFEKQIENILYRGKKYLLAARVNDDKAFYIKESI